MTVDFHKLGKQNKRKGARYETESAKFWSKALDSNIKRTPRSGAFTSWPGDLIDLGNSIFKEFIVDLKFGTTALPKKIDDEMSKLTDEAQNKSHFLEIAKPYQEPLIVIKRKYFARLLSELQGFRKENEL